MKLSDAPLLILLTLGLMSGCSAGARHLPAEYRVLARSLAQEAKSSPDAFRDNKGISEIIAEGHSIVMDLQGIHSADVDINYVALQAQAAFADAIRHLETINGLPKPRSAGELFVESFIHGVYGNVFAGYALGMDAENKQQAIVSEVEGLCAAVERADAAHLLLPKIAEKNCAPLSSSPGRLAVDFSESWGCFGPHDWLTLRNRGQDLEDCTIVIELIGALGEARTNVHFLPKWAGNSAIYARYAPGEAILGRKVGRMTVNDVKTVDVTVWSPSFSTKLSYLYEGAERDRHVADYCKDLKFAGRYRPFEAGVIWDTQRAACFALQGVALLPKCGVDVTFRKVGNPFGAGPLFSGTDSKRSWHWEIESWRKGDEKIFETPKGALPFDPDYIDLAISFPGTSYRYQTTLKVRT